MERKTGDPVPAEVLAAVFRTTRGITPQGSTSRTRFAAEGRPRQEPARITRGRVVPGTRYRIIRWLGEGGMGVIYEAEHLDIRRKVALKVIREDSSQWNDAARKLQSEAKTASQIGSPYIVQVFEVGELPDGRTFIALELVEGHDLFQELDAAPMSLSRLLGILRQLCKGLDAAHSAGIVHCDIKPENVLIHRRDGREDAVKIVDFGISRVRGSFVGTSHRPTGTPAYMSPERWTGEGEEDPRSDIYSVGCLAFELLAGRPPFVGEPSRLMMDHFEKPVPVLREISAKLEVPAPLEAVIRQCLAKRPEHRYCDMRDLEGALCEAQIAMGIETVWDDLPLPEVDVTRREALRRRMPTHDRSSLFPPRHWLPPLVLGGLIGVFGLARSTSLHPGITERSSTDTAIAIEIDRLTGTARTAATTGAWIYPRMGSAEPTAYRCVLGVEQLDLPARVNGRGAELRREFADALIRLGDRYWTRSESRPFASDYYAQALLFDPTNEHAATRAALTAGELATLRTKASQLDFTEDELRVVTPLALLAGDDERKAILALEAYFAHDDRMSVTQAHRIEQLLRTSGRPLAAFTDPSHDR